MASNKRLNQDIHIWALEHAETLSLEVTQCTWNKTFIPDVTDLIVSISIDNKKFEGRGTDRTADIAFTKGIAEALERSTVYQYALPNSSGIAAHLTHEKAKENAVFELIERHWFLHHFFNQLPFGEILNPGDFLFDQNEKLDNSFLSYLKFIDEQKIHLVLRGEVNGIEILSSNESTKCYPVMCAAFGKNYQHPFGSHFHLGCKDTLTASIECALLALFRNLAVHFSDVANQNFIPLSLDEFNKNTTSRVMGPQEHQCLALDLNYAENLASWTNMIQKNKKKESNKFNIEKFELKELKLNLNFETPFVFYQAINPELIPLTFGILPHPLG